MKNASHDRHPQVHHQGDHGGVIEKMAEQRAVQLRQHQPQNQGTRLVEGKITSRVMMNCFHWGGWRTPGLGG